ncbi:MAG: TonB-dependent receptor plug domain-containing protein [Alphaproteobacteria bacterium]|nr:TonB-dependent receptor plug domain-containing protein [Alphaproteobacteria bacterium]
MVRAFLNSMAFLSAAGLIGTAGAAYAQAVDESDAIVVTARQRAESLQETPLSVNAFTARTIEEAGIDRPSDFIALTPNVSFIQTTNVGETQVHIRGVIQPRDTEPPFAYVVDGVLVPNPNAFNGELVDIQQIEVIKGPIGSIYGRNAIGGAITVNTVRPGPEFEGRAQAAYEFEGEEYKLGGYVSGPVIQDRLYARATVSYTDRAGYFDNITRNTEEDPFEEIVFRGRAIWDVAPNVELDFGAGYGKVEGFSFNFNNQFSGTPGFTNGVSTADTSIPFVGNLASFNDQERYNASARLTWDVLGGTLASYVAYTNLEESMGGEGAADLALFGAFLGVPGQPTPGDFFTDPSLYEGYGPTDRDGAQYQERNQSDTSFEVRFTSDADQRFRYIVGGYYIDFDRDILLLTGDFGIGTSIREAPVLSPGQAGVSGTGGDNANSAWAVFGQAAYDIVDNLELSVALRYDAEDRENVNTVDGGAIAPLNATRTAEFDRLQPRVSLRYEASDEVTFYATYGEGFRSGGFNPLGSRFRIINVDGKTDTTVQDAFPEETSKSYELGAHLSILDGRLAVNAAAFSTQVENAHFFQFFPFSLSRVISIVQENEITGAEFDFQARLTDYLTVFGGAGILDSEITENNELPGTVGNNFPFTPDSTVLLGAQLRTPVWNGVDFLGRVEWNRTGEMWFDTENTPGTARPEIDLVNARIGLEGERWSATVFSRNLFEEDYNVDAVVLNVPPASTFNFVTKGTPRTIGIELGMRF